MVIYDRSDEKIKLIVGSFTDEEVDISFFVVDHGDALDGIMDFEYFDDNCEVLGWL